MKVNFETKRKLSVIFTVIVSFLLIFVLSVSANAETKGEIIKAGGMPVKVTKTELLNLKYDDYYNISSKYQGYEIVSVSKTKASSFRVEGGEKTDEKDEYVVTKPSSVVFHAAGIGTADAILVKSEDLKGYKEEKPLDGIRLKIKVNPATLSVMYIVGQSNAQGSCGDKKYHNEDAVDIKSGTAYSTYAPNIDSNAKNITAGAICTSAKISNAEEFVPGNLTSNASESINGNELLSPLNMFSSVEYSKSGMDSALAYQWQKLTGNKVWIVNLSAGATSVKDWGKGKPYFVRAQKMISGTKDVLAAESKAGHFNVNKKVLVWFHGITDKLVSPEEYINGFYNFQKNIFKLMNFDAMGIVLTRSSLGNSFMNQTDLTLSGPRIAQAYFAYSKAFPKVHMFSYVNEEWVSDESVSNYMSKKYPSGTFTYAQKENTNLKETCTTIKEMHPETHYTQAAHNENGIDAANNIFDVLYKPEKRTATSGYWISKDGKKLTDGEVYKAYLGEDFTLSPRFNPVISGKYSNVVVDENYLSYNEKTESFTPLKNGKTKIELINNDAKIIATLNVEIKSYKYNTPTIKNMTVTAKGIKINIKETGADKYRLLYKKGYRWKTIDEFTGSSFMWTSYEWGNTYQLTVRAISKDNKEYESPFNKNGKSVKAYLNTPVITQAKETKAGISLKWTDVKATKYRVYYLSDEGEWKVLGESIKPSYIYKDIEKGIEYKYTVRAIKGDGSVYTSDFSSVGVAVE